MTKEDEILIKKYLDLINCYGFENLKKNYNIGQEEKIMLFKKYWEYRIKYWMNIGKDKRTKEDDNEEADLICITYILNLFFRVMDLELECFYYRYINSKER